MMGKFTPQSNFDPTPEETVRREAILYLLEACGDHSDIVLQHDLDAGVFLVAEVHDGSAGPTEDDSGNEVERPAGTIEYMVCDGLPGERSTSHDFYNLADAVAEFVRVIKEGW